MFWRFVVFYALFLSWELFSLICCCRSYNFSFICLNGEVSSPKINMNLSENNSQVIRKCQQKSFLNHLLWFCLFHEVHLFDPYIDVDMPINNYYSNEILIEIRERYALMISQYMYNDWARLINGSSIDYPSYYSLLYSSNPAKLGFPTL